MSFLIMINKFNFEFSDRIAGAKKLMCLSQRCLKDVSYLQASIRSDKSKIAHARTI